MPPNITVPLASTVCYALAYLTGLAAFCIMAKKRRLATQGMMAVMGAGLIGGLVSANVIQILTGSPGKTVLGAIAGGYLVVTLYKRKLGITRPTGDMFAVAICAGEAVGRWGCFFGGCCYGKACSVGWAVWQHDAWRHPAQLYLSAACLVILGILLLYMRRNPPENAIFYLQGALYCIARFVVEFYREGSVLAVGLTLAQWACLAGFIFFAIRLRMLLSAQRPDFALES